MVNCPSCHAEQSPATASCPICGSLLSGENATANWEYRDIVVPLNLRSNDRNLSRRFDALVHNQLHEEAQAGWHPGTPVDWGYMWGAGRVKRSGRRPWYAIAGIGRAAYTFESVTIRLKRSRQGSFGGLNGR